MATKTMKNKSNRKPRINRRIVDAKRHTLGYIITGGVTIDRDRAVQMAERGDLAGVRVINSSQGTYIQSTGSKRLYDLPMDIAGE